MTEQEKQQHPHHKTLGGYLKTRTREEEKTCWDTWWRARNKIEQEVIVRMPNFNPVKFKEFTGIDTSSVSYAYLESRPEERERALLIETILEHEGLNLTFGQVREILAIVQRNEEKPKPKEI